MKRVVYLALGDINHKTVRNENLFQILFITCLTRKIQENPNFIMFH